MKVGDLVRLRSGIGTRTGLLIKDLSPPKAPPHWVILWSDGVRDTVNAHMLEVINESR